jgi:hypothetical protein
MYYIPKGKTRKTEETKMKKNTWAVKALTAEEPGRLVWQEIKTFDNAVAADEWLCNYVRANGYSITDFNLVRK